MGEVEEGDGGKAGVAEGKEKGYGRDERSVSRSKDVDDMPSWVLGGFESAEAEHEGFERRQQEMMQKGGQMDRMWERTKENMRASKKLEVRIKELERESEQQG